jgi:dienelactone hydrolase
MKYLCLCLFVISTSFHSHGDDALKRETVPYSIGGAIYKGYLVYDQSYGQIKRPGIILAPEWWGQTTFERDAADRLARKGYIVFVLDLYGNARSTDDPKKAQELQKDAQSDKTALDQRFDAGLKKLLLNPTVDANRLGALGYGLGGGLVLDQARLRKDLKAVVSYYGGLANDGRALSNGPTAEILVLTGDIDFYIGKDQVKDFEHEMTVLKAKYKVITYPKAAHEFANKLADKIGTKLHLPFEYNEQAAAKSWEDMTAFFQRKLSPPAPKS